MDKIDQIHYKTRYKVVPTEKWKSYDFKRLGGKSVEVEKKQGVFFGMISFKNVQKYLIEDKL